MKLTTVLLSTLSAVALAACGQSYVVPTPIPGAPEDPGPVWLSDLPAAPWPEECEGFVNLSFDDGPTERTRDLLTILAHYEVTATFFTLGANEEKNARLITEILQQGHQIGNHTLTHSDLTTLSLDDALADINGWTAVHNDLGHEATTLFRPPYGATSPELRAAVEDLGMTQVLWSVDSKDFEATSAEQVVEQSEGLSDGGILLLHDGKEHTVEALPNIIQHYHEQGLCFGPVAVVDDELPTDIPDTTHRARAVSE